MAEQPNNVVDINTYRAPQQGTRFNNDTHLEFHKSNLPPAELAQRAVDAVYGAAGTPEINKTMIDIQNAGRRTAVLEWAATQEVA